MACTPCFSLTQHLRTLVKQSYGRATVCGQCVRGKQRASGLTVLSQRHRHQIHALLPFRSQRKAHYGVYHNGCVAEHVNTHSVVFQTLRKRERCTKNFVILFALKSHKMTTFVGSGSGKSALLLETSAQVGACRAQMQGPSAGTKHIDI